MMADDSTGYAGQAGLTSGNSSRNTVHFQAKQQIAHVRTLIPVKIIATHGGGVGPDPTHDVQPLIDQTDGQNNATPHGTVYGIAGPRLQGGNGAIINDFQVDDIAYMHVADRDISSFRSANGQASPGSERRHSMSDGVLVRGHNGNGTPKQYVQFRSDGVTVNDVSGHQVSTSASKIIVAPKEGSGAIVYLGGDGVHGTYDFVMTVSGPSTNVKARIS